MIHFDLPKEKSSILKVIGVGGGGSNAVNHMFSQNIDNVNFIICNTDAQAIAQSKVPNKIQLGPHLTQGLGAGANPEIGKQATEESLEEIKRILEVNTKMAFITAGMGGGTGTGGAPIISKICKDLDILTVGIVTTPFAYEGRKRQLQAEEGIEQLKQYVDTLLVISNDKLRHQFGNLKMKDAFAKADNVLATAAKCITDVINSTGQINVDFADVCTVMRNGGVAILGSATAEGDTRAQKAIEEALNSPLLNDNDIRGAKWILININSAKGDHEFTMDEVEVIQNYLLSHAGDNTDVILGLGYDSTLERKIGITLIATGFEHKTPFYKREEQVPEPQKEEKILMTLNTPPEEPKRYAHVIQPVATPATVTVQPPSPQRAPQPPAPEAKASLAVPEPESLMPSLVDLEPEPYRSSVSFMLDEEPAAPAEEPIEKFELAPEETYEPAPIVIARVEEPAPVKEPEPAKPVAPSYRNETPSAPRQQEPPIQQNIFPGSVVSGGYLAKPSNIYAEPVKPTPAPSMPPTASAQPTTSKPASPVHVVSPRQQAAPVQAAMPVTPVTPVPPFIVNGKEEEPAMEMKLVIKEETPDMVAPPVEAAPPVVPSPVAELPFNDEVEEQRRRATERVQKLRNLSFNINGTDTSNEFDTVPAYIRRNLELYNTVNNVENYYSNYTVKPDENNKSQISTINTFLDGKKPD